MMNDKMMGHTVGLNGPLRIELMPNGISAILVRPFIVRCKSGRIVEVPAGFQTDFASVPRAFWRLIPPWGPYSSAAVVHDYLYATGLVSRAEADKIFLELMKRLDVPVWKRNVMYWAVRMAGASRYTKAKKRNV